MGAVGTAARAAIFIIAHNRASGPLTAVGKSMGKTAVQAGVMASAFAGLNKVFGFLGDHLGIISVALAGVTTALATKDWLNYNQAVRSAQLQFVAYGASLEDAIESTSALTKILGRTAATDLFRSTEAVKQLSLTMDEDLIRSMLEMAEMLDEKYGVEMPQAFAILGAAINEGALGPLNELLKTDFTTIDEARTAIDRMSKAAKGIPLSNIEKLNDEMTRFSDIVGPLIARVSDFFAAFPLGTMLVINGILEGIANSMNTVGLALAGGLAGFLLGGPVGAVIGVAGGLAAGAVLEEAPWNQPGPMSPLSAGGKDVIVNVTLDGQVLRQYIVNTVTREARLVGGVAGESP